MIIHVFYLLTYFMQLSTQQEERKGLKALVSADKKEMKTKINNKRLLIYHLNEKGTRESHPSVHDLHSTTRLADGHEDGIPLSLPQCGD